MNAETQRQQILDDEHLRLLSLFHYVSGGLTLAFSLFMFLYLGVFSFVLSNMSEFEDMEKVAGAPDPQQVLGIMVTIFSAMVVLNLVYGILLIVSGVFLKRRKHRMFSFIVALPNLLFIPYGTLLSVCTLMVLSRESVKSGYMSSDNGGRSF